MRIDSKSLRKYGHLNLDCEGLQLNFGKNTQALRNFCRRTWHIFIVDLRDYAIEIVRTARWVLVQSFALAAFFHGSSIEMAESGWAWSLLASKDAPVPR